VRVVPEASLLGIEIVILLTSFFIRNSAGTNSLEKAECDITLDSVFPIIEATKKRKLDRQASRDS
jgi:hypothetical protein